MNTSTTIGDGLRETRRCRTTGRMVSVYDGRLADMDTFAGRWQTVCEDHGWVISHTTLAVARSWLSAADEWCEECQAAAEGDHDESVD